MAKPDVFYINAHGNEVAINFNSRPTVPEGKLIVLFTEHGLPVKEGEAIMIREDMKKNPLKYTDVETIRAENSRARIYYPGNKLPLFHFYKYNEKASAQPQGIYKLNLEDTTGNALKIIPDTIPSMVNGKIHFSKLLTTKKFLDTYPNGIYYFTSCRIIQGQYGEIRKHVLEVSREIERSIQKLNQERKKPSYKTNLLNGGININKSTRIIYQTAYDSFLERTDVGREQKIEELRGIQRVLEHEQEGNTADDIYYRILPWLDEIISTEPESTRPAYEITKERLKEKIEGVFAPVRFVRSLSTAQQLQAVPNGGTRYSKKKKNRKTRKAKANI